MPIKTDVARLMVVESLFEAARQVAVKANDAAHKARAERRTLRARIAELKAGQPRTMSAADDKAAQLADYHEKDRALSARIEELEAMAEAAMAESGAAQALFDNCNAFVRDAR